MICTKSTFLLFIISLTINITFGSLSFRADHASELKVKAGIWGDWSNKVYCNAGKFVVGFYLKVEKDQGGGDDSAANGFDIICSDGENPTSNNNGKWGEWSSVNCPTGSYLIGYKAKVENNQANGDDSALNSIRGRCSNSQRTEIEPSNAGKWGDWGDFEHSFNECPPRTSVCGFRQKVEANQGNGDDSALNEVRLYCCHNPKVLSAPRGKWVRVAGIGGGGQVSITTKVGVTNHQQHELTNTFSASITATVEAGFAFGSVSLSATASAEMSKTTTTAVTQSIEVEKSFTCQEGDVALYQWVVTMNEDALTENFDFDIKSNDYWCVSDDSYTPKCPFGFCKDEDCQTCNTFT